MPHPIHDTVYVSDLDGTLLGPDGRLSPGSRAAIEQLLERGVQFTVASARSVISMRGALGDLALRLPVVCFNGGFVSDLSTLRHIEVFDLGEDARAAWTMAKDLGLVPMVSTTDGVSEDRVFIPHQRNPGVEWYVNDRQRAQDPRLRLVDEPGEAIDQRVTCLTVIDRRERLEPYAAALASTFGDRLRPHLFDDLYTVGWSWLTVHAGQATKARAVRSVLEAAGLADRRLVAFGDQENDLPLLDAADHAVATANAAEAVKAVADEVIGHHQDDAVVKWMLEAVG